MAFESSIETITHVSSVVSLRRSSERCGDRFEFDSIVRIIKIQEEVRREAGQ